MRTSLFCLLLLVLVGACQSVPEGGSADRARPNLITQAELDDLPAITALQAIERLRPRWLRARISTLRSGAGIRHTATVFVDGMPRGGLDTLEGIQSKEIEEIRFLSASDATTRYGTGYPRGIIEVSTKRGLEPPHLGYRWGGSLGQFWGQMIWQSLENQPASSTLDEGG